MMLYKNNNNIVFA